VPKQWQPMRSGTAPPRNSPLAQRDRQSLWRTAVAIRNNEPPVRCSASDCPNFATIAHEGIHIVEKHASDALEPGLLTFRRKFGYVENR